MPDGLGVRPRFLDRWAEDRRGWGKQGSATNHVDMMPDDRWPGLFENAIRSSGILPLFPKKRQDAAGTMFMNNPG